MRGVAPGQGEWILPQPEMHVLLAEDALAYWLAQPERAPFDAGDAACRNAFVHGSLAPDMGLFPGGALHLSRCIHLGGATEVGRWLIAEACSDVERAFAWGWVAHVLADVRIHPLINEGGEALLAAQARPIGRTRDRLVAHIRVELGVEGWYALQRAGRPRTRLVHVFTAASIMRLVTPLRRVYGVNIGRREVLSGHRRVTRFATLCSQLAELLARDLAAPADGALPGRADFLRLPGVRRAASALITRSSPVYAFLNPVRPEPWLISKIDAEVAGFPDGLDALVHGGLEGCPDYDLNTGRRLLPIRCSMGSPRVA